jgi:AraC family transcriptional regulator, regulatory protein of adaptative response / DNA-3-methyladenine glycosylase II
VERVVRLGGIDSDPTLASAQLTADATLGPLITSLPRLRVPAHGPFKVAVHAVVS